jgi:hypothetical protein
MKKRGGYLGGSTLVGPRSPLVSHDRPKVKKPRGPVDPSAPWEAELREQMHEKIDAAIRNGGSARGLGTPDRFKKKPKG